MISRLHSVVTAGLVVMALVAFNLQLVQNKLNMYHGISYKLLISSNISKSTPEAAEYGPSSLSQAYEQIILEGNDIEEVNPFSHYVDCLDGMYMPNGGFCKNKNKLLYLLPRPKSSSSTPRRVNSIEGSPSSLARHSSYNNLEGDQPAAAHGPSQNESCVDNKSMATGGFCLSKHKLLSGSNWLWDSELCKRMELLFGHATVVDFGAGLGHYGRCMLRIKDNVVQSDNPMEMSFLMNEYEAAMMDSKLINKPRVIKSWTGYDGAANIDEISSGFIQYLDLGKEVDLNERWDWAVSLEVGEHIPKESEDVFIDNIARHACKGIVLSWAVPGQNGQGHINNQYNKHVIKQLEKRGFEHALSSQTFLRKAVLLPWFINTIMVFKAKDSNRCTKSI
ncbi:unnamed protein product [Meganyctiphanes norvegica]|uniref:Methyltransferase type 11 domain-containing protein n=1 Tax=Meganyctiphanes norvegica TaxID=48144 RepID=A0AAV2R339_MEGNR